MYLRIKKIHNGGLVSKMFEINTLSYHCSLLVENILSILFCIQRLGGYYSVILENKSQAENGKLVGRICCHRN